MCPPRKKEQRQQQKLGKHEELELSCALCHIGDCICRVCSEPGTMSQ
jgi:hypothetical protein